MWNDGSVSVWLLSVDVWFGCDDVRFWLWGWCGIILIMWGKMIIVVWLCCGVCVLVIMFLGSGLVIV